ncbi:MAG: hypothetical protein KGP29_04085, partial [Proteobacteria bacterium]|nr:hypothetical protein [Pseudomonadota bacterium]
HINIPFLFTRETVPSKELGYSIDKHTIQQGEVTCSQMLRFYQAQEKTEADWDGEKIFRKIDVEMADRSSDVIINLTRYQDRKTGDVVAVMRRDSTGEEKKTYCPETKTDKIGNNVSLDRISISAKDDSGTVVQQLLEPTAFTVHSGGMHGGHWVSYSLELRGEDPVWVYRSDTTCRIVDESYAMEQSKQACSVKYSPLVDNPDGPPRKEGKARFRSKLAEYRPNGIESRGNQCWGNAGMNFMLSCADSFYQADLVRDLPQIPNQRQALLRNANKAKGDRDVERREAKPVKSVSSSKSSSSKVSTEAPKENITEKLVEIVLNSISDRPGTGQCYQKLLDELGRAGSELDKASINQELRKLDLPTKIEDIFREEANAFLNQFIPQPKSSEGNSEIKKAIEISEGIDGVRDFFADMENHQNISEMLRSDKFAQGGEKSFVHDPSAFIAEYFQSKSPTPTAKTEAGTTTPTPEKKQWKKKKEKPLTLEAACVQAIIDDKKEELKKLLPAANPRVLSHLKKIAEEMQDVELSKDIEKRLSDKKAPEAKPKTSRTPKDTHPESNLSKNSHSDISLLGDKGLTDIKVVTNASTTAPDQKSLSNRPPLMVSESNQLLDLYQNSKGEFVALGIKAEEFRKRAMDYYKGSEGESLGKDAIEVLRIYSARPNTSVVPRSVEWVAIHQEAKKNEASRE